MQFAGLLVTAVVFLVVGYVRCVRDARQLVKDDQAFLRSLVPDAVLIAGDGKEKTTAVGRLADGTRASLELITNTLTLRWLPRQLVVARLPTRLPITQRVNLVRATAESSLATVGLHDPASDGEFGPGVQLTVRLPGQEDMLSEEIADQVRELFADPRVQQLLLRPDGVRLVYEVGIARADTYRITRKVKIERSSLTGLGVRQAIDRARQIADVMRTIKTEDKPTAETQRC